MIIVKFHWYYIFLNKARLVEETPIYITEGRVSNVIKENGIWESYVTIRRCHSNGYSQQRQNCVRNNPSG